MANESDTTPIHNVYAQRFAADLETNRKEQELVSVQITELEVRLAQLKSDENWLLGIQGTLPSEAEKERAAAAPATAPADDTRDAPEAPVTPAASATGPASGGVPKPRQARKATGTTSRARTATPAKKASSAAPAGTKADVKAESKAGAKTSPKAVTKARATTRKSAAPKPPVAATVPEPKADKAGKTGRAAEPPLRELVLALLVGAAEPRLVSEVASALIEAHPGRPTSTQVVRNALEALAKKGSIEKEHKQGSVMYTAPRPAAPEPAPAPAPAPAAAAEPVAEPVAAPETVAAEV
ncbi:hypothetical protein SLAV_03315 [Streptomyces lavendulae subsp. lavendulae]|uniref:Uncharacterized protein n=1 Tax=Streptomyces lavendulae subsp. lavendulae TaxID=58340 RepID=A0A2K8P745_STRLA|nr:hypothetical protein [Streptomyces lavendulae]ATZ22572.1 hypothetical protein SLAV_03315 [Streptomyces lavendulae subsp. lavendulae]QUQ52414.1 hypothetical protein SLLC_01350 [Streptomyces lavendulae subsp. lavendulae]